MRPQKRPSVPVITPLAVLLGWVVALVCAFFPLTGTPGPEAAQILGAVGGPLLFIAGAVRAGYRLPRGFLGDALMQVSAMLALMIGFIVIIALADLGHESCAPGRGYLPFFFLSFPVLALNSALGLLIGRAIGNPVAAGIGAAVALVGLTGWLVFDYWLAPSFKVLSHMLVAVDGDMMRGRSVSAGVVAFRTATLFFALGWLGLGAGLFPTRRTTGLTQQRSSSTIWWSIAAAGLILGAVIHSGAKDALVVPRSTFESDYSLERQSGPLTVRADPRHTTLREVEAILAEAEFWVRRIESRIEIAPSEPITVFLHADRDAIARYTGAEHMHFAVPWKREVHISKAVVPHRSLGHELAHIIGGEFAQGLFNVPARFGFVVNSGLVEGFAMAMSPELSLTGELTLMEQAAALTQSDMAQDPMVLFGSYRGMFDFWSHAPGRAYVTAGALMQALLASHGPNAVRQAYAEGDLDAAFDSSAALEKFLEEHHQTLMDTPLPKDALASVTRTFRGTSILRETCDPEALAATDDVRAAARSGDFDKAEDRARELEDPLSPPTLRDLAAIADDNGDKIRAISYLERAAELPGQSPRAYAETYVTIGDLLSAVERFRDAAAYYGRIDADAVSPSGRRLLLAKRRAVERLRASAGRDEVARAIVHLLLRDRRFGDDASRLLALSEALRAMPESPLADFARYLLARQHLQRGYLDAGIDLLLQILERRAPLGEPFDTEVRLGLAMGHARRGDPQVAAAGFSMLAEDAERAASRVRMRDLQQRAEAAAELSMTGARLLFGTERGGSL